MSSRGVLIDAGPLVAILNRRDNDHRACVEYLKGARKPLLTTWMPVTEALYLLDFSVDAQCALLEMVERGVPQLLDLGPEDLPEIRAMMTQYQDQPMDFADATLVQVARRENLSEIFTLDRRDFSVYRLQRNRAFTIVPT